MDRVYQATLTLREYGVSCEQQRRDDKGHDKGHKDHEKPKGKRIRDAEECTSCGRQNHTTANCLLKTHPDANKSAEPWLQSASGKAWKAKSEEVLPFTRTLSGEPWTCPTQPKGKFAKRQKCECSTIASLDNITGNTDVVPCEIILTHTSLTTHMPVDSGALDGDYINREIADKLQAGGVKPVGAKKRVCSAFEEMCEITEGKFLLQVNFINEHTQKMEMVHTQAACINTKFPVIIGRPTIKRNNLTTKLPSQFMAPPTNVRCLCKDRNVYGK